MVLKVIPRGKKRIIWDFIAVHTPDNFFCRYFASLSDRAQLWSACDSLCILVTSEWGPDSCCLVNKFTSPLLWSKDYLYVFALLLIQLVFKTRFADRQKDFLEIFPRFLKSQCVFVFISLSSDLYLCWSHCIAKAV